MLTYQCIPVGMLESNSYLIKDDATGALALVDCGLFSKQLRESAAALGGDLRYILLTHAHFDHTQGIPAAKAEYPGARVAVGEKDAAFLRGETSAFPGRTIGRGKLMEPDFLLHDGDIIVLGESRLRVIATPGHSPGGVCFFSEADDLLFTGDTLFYEEVGRADLVGGDWQTLQDSIRLLYTLDGNPAVLPGHGPASQLDHERKHNPYVKM